jgi:hypothetical protein
MKLTGKDIFDRPVRPTEHGQPGDLDRADEPTPSLQLLAFTLPSTAREELVSGR